MNTRKTHPVLYLLLSIYFGLPSGTAIAKQSLESADVTRPTSGTTYYNRPGASITEHDEALQNCIDIASYTNAGAILGMYNLRTNPANNPTSKSRIQATIENCMVVSGWRVIQISRNDAREFLRQPQNVISERFSLMVGAENPSGQIKREFSNEAYLNDTIIDGWQNYARNNSLSLTASGLRAPEARSPVMYPPPPPGSALSHGPFEPEDIPSIPKNSSIVIVQTSGKVTDQAMYFEKLRPKGQQRALVLNRTDAAEFILTTRYIGRPSTQSESSNLTLAYVVSPGDWRFSGRMSEAGGLMMDFCLGAPTFNIAPGEVIFLGRFDMAGQSLGPVMSFDRASLTSAIGAEMAERAQAATWRNGATTSCEHGIFTYALEFPDTPFVEGYTGGSAAVPIVLQ